MNTDQRFYALVVNALLLLLGVPGVIGQEGEGRRNVLVILSDDQRADTIHALGNAIIRTPHLDRLAERGTAFTRAHIMGGLVGAVCQPSRCMILSGRSVFRAPPVPGAGVKLWPEEFRKADYITFGTGKWHNGPASYGRCFSAGDEVFFGGMNDQTKVPVQHFDAEGKYPRTRQRIGEKYSTELFTDAAVSFLERYGKEKPDRPFVMWVAFTVPHDPRMTPPGGMLYEPEKMALPKNFMPAHPFDNGEMEVRDEKLLPRPRPVELVKKDLADYYTLITHMDGQIGRILEALEKSGQRERTLVVFAGDNGLAVGSHGLLGKQNCYEHSMGVPLIVAGPGVKAGQKTDAMVYLMDLWPTIAEMTGGPAPTGVEAKSFAGVLRGEDQEHRRTLFYAYRDVQRAVRDERFKYIRYEVKGQMTEQLFDLHEDPEEMKDLSGSAEQAATMARMRRLLADQQRLVGDPKAPAS